MKKIIAISMALLLLAGCSAAPATPADPATQNNNNAAADTSKIKTGLGVITTIKNSTDATDEKDGTVQVDTTMAAVSVDEKGVIVSVTLDVAQTKVPFDKAGTIKADKTAEVPTKKDLGDKYGMKVASKIGKDWHEQAKAFEDWCVGKTLDQVMGLSVVQRDESHPAVPNDPALTSSVTITVDAYQQAISEAIKNAK